uniref:Protein kinase domain-containing protein n=2 Tax=Physcomitrium patens TaxID=3218 RepID=A0A7I4FDB5_PHYPA|nr:cold-responsive protein kinase 1-like [Physcomitrium patens]|eukprot:XP_024358383.1 cold-responsive protein kinase 1-like [Physcomitrella patens]
MLCAWMMVRLIVCRVNWYADSKRNLPLVLGISVSLIVFAAVALSLLVWRRRVRSRSLPLIADRDEIMKIEGRPTLFSYKELKDATKNFHIDSKLGEGGFGIVYKGILYDGSEVAVKQLSTKSRQGNEEFLNEVTLITGVQHRNLVKLRGCCLKGRERLLVYEYLENKSLYQALFDPGKRLHLNWRTRVKILVGTARGLAYLHEGCQARIVHRDIKSSNILLDKELNPKIADFGLARLFTDDESHVSTRVAGTLGYLAPEYAMRGQLTEKADVFSFGIMTLEVVSGRKNFNARLPVEETYLLDWTWTLHDGGNILAVLDPLLMDEPYPEEEVKRVTEIALLCTQSLASMRPSMSHVVSMLIGESEVKTSNATKPSIRMFSSSLLPPSRQGSLSCGQSHSSFHSRIPSSTQNGSSISILSPR